MTRKLRVLTYLALQTRAIGFSGELWSSCQSAKLFVPLLKWANSARGSTSYLTRSTTTPSVEPYPPLDPKDLAARPLAGFSSSSSTDGEVRQLSASVAPDSYRRRSLVGRSSISVTPAPAPESRPGGALFRREATTEEDDAQSVRRGVSVTPSVAGLLDNDDDDGGGGLEEEDDQMRALRATSTLLANDWPPAAEGDDGLPSLEDIISRSAGWRRCLKMNR